jgi:hypothetical protein
LLIHTQPSPTATAGLPFAVQPVVFEGDQYGNVETGDNSTTITASLASGNGSLAGTTTMTLFAGAAPFVGLGDNTAGVISLNFAGGGFKAGPSNNVVISHGLAAQLVIAVPPFASVTAGNPLTDPIVINEEDAFGNILTDDNSTAVTVSLASGSGVLNGVKTATVAGGVASFDDLEDDTAGDLTLQFAAGNLPPVVSAKSTVKAAPATKVIVNRPPSGVTAGIAFGLTVHTNDPFDNLDTTYDGPVSVALASGSAGTLAGTTTMMATAGVADFTDLVDTVSGPLSLDVTSGSLTSTTTPPVTISPAAPSQLVIHVEPSPSATAGQPFARQPVIYETDQYNNLISSDSSTMVAAFLSSGPGTLQGTATTTLTGGVATFTNLEDDTAGVIALKFSGGGFTSLASSSIVISPAAASKLVLQTPPSTTATAGKAFDTQPVLELEDQFSNLETGDNSTSVAVSLSSGAGPLQGATSVIVNGGIATFAGLADNMAETITFNYVSGNLTAGPSTVVVNPGTASQLVFQSQPPSQATAGEAFQNQPIILEEDQFNNIETGDFSTAVTASPSLGSGPLKGITTVTVVGGIATFTNLEDDRAESLALKFAGGGLTSSSSTSIIVRPATASKLVIAIPPSPEAIAGQVFASQPVVEIEDAYSNVEASDNSTSVTVSLSSGPGLLEGVTTVSVHAGVASFAGLADNSAGTLTLSYSGGGLEAGPSTVVVKPAAASKLVVQAQPSLQATAGQPFAAQPVIALEDQYDNLETGDSNTVIAADVSSGDGPLHGASVIVKGGVATFTALEDDIAETLSIRFTGAGFSVSPMSSILVKAGRATKLVVVSDRSGEVPAGSAFEIVVQAQDPFGNVDPTFNGNINLALADNPNNETLGGVLTAQAVAGIATFTGLTLDRPSGVYSLTLTGGGLETESPPTPVAPPTPAQIPTVIGESVVFSQKTNKKGKSQGKKVFSGFKIQYSIAMDPSTAGLSTLYKMDSISLKRKKNKTVKVFTPVNFTAKYDQASESVTLTVAGKNPFAKGGQITIVTGSPTGVNSQVGVPLNSIYAILNILANAKNITRE